MNGLNSDQRSGVKALTTSMDAIEFSAFATATLCQERCTKSTNCSACSLTGEAALTVRFTAGLISTRVLLRLSPGSGNIATFSVGFGCRTFVTVSTLDAIIIAACPALKRPYAAAALVVAGEGWKQRAPFMSWISPSARCQPGVPRNVTFPAFRFALQFGSVV